MNSPMKQMALMFCHLRAAAAASCAPGVISGQVGGVGLPGLEHRRQSGREEEHGGDH